jgi:hypothetical protein
VPESANLFVSLLRNSFGLALFALLGYAGGVTLAKGTASPDGKYRRGAVVSSALKVAARRKSGGGIPLAGVPVALEDETKHFSLPARPAPVRARPFAKC